MGLTRLGKWIIDNELGRGGMGQVYLGHEDPATTSSPRQAALKVLAPELAQEVGFLQRFQREIDILKQLHHPHIVGLYESGVEDGRYYYAMEYIAGKNFEEVLNERGRLPWREVLDIALQVCPALKHAHDHGIIHRDIKPQNLIRAEDGTVKLTDFGVAKVFAGKQLTATGGLVGTAEYLSPEQAAGKPVTNRSDLYSFGVVLYLLLTGRPPFQGRSVLDLMHKHRFGQFDPPQRLVLDIPHELDETVCLLMEKDPAHRPASGLVLQRRLEVLKRKLDRKEQQTMVADVTEAEHPSTLAENDEPPPGPATLMSRLMRRYLEGPPRGPVATFVNQPVVLVLLFMTCVGVIVWSMWFRPHASADMSAAETITTISEAQRFYQQGQRLYRSGDKQGARDVWRDLVHGFKDVESEKEWVRQAEERLSQLADLPSDTERWASVRQSLAHARELRDAGHPEKADKIWRALENLYWNDSSARSILEQIRKDRGVR